MNSSQPLVSVLMTVYNREHFIREAIESVLASTYTNFELIITDDGSTDQSVAVAREYEVKDKRIRVYQNEKNLGDYINRNRAASYAKGKYLKYLDSDDLIFPWGLEAMVYCMEKEPTAAIGFASNISLNIKYPVLYNTREAYRQYYFKNYLFCIGPTGTIIKKEIFDLLGGFSGEQYMGDTEMWLRIAQKQSVISMPSNLLYWREHEGQQIVEEKKNLKIEAIRHNLDKKMLKDVNCPLFVSEAKSIYRNLINIKCRGIFKDFLNAKFTKSINRSKYLNLTFFDFLQSLRKNKIPKL